MRDFSKVSRSEVYRYMGFKGEMPEMPIAEMTEVIIKELHRVSNPKFCSVDTSVVIDENVVSFKTFCVKSKSLSKHLSDCTSAVLFAATLGSEADMLIYKYSLISPSKAVAAQAAATAMIEMYADDICSIFEEEAKKDGLYITKRFSPGYGDLSLECQSDFLGALDAGKRIGLCITDSGMLTPVKSVTAVVGRTSIKHDCAEHKCKNCKNLNCAYRTEG